MLRRECEHCTVERASQDIELFVWFGSAELSSASRWSRAATRVDAVQPTTRGASSRRLSPRFAAVPTLTQLSSTRMTQPIIFYDLVPASGSKLFYSPNTIKTRLSLAHKGVAFETKAVTYSDTRTWLKDKTGFERVFCECLFQSGMLSGFTCRRGVRRGRNRSPARAAGWQVYHGFLEDRRVTFPPYAWHKMPPKKDELIKRTILSRWLDETYPDAPSLFQPDHTVPVDPESPDVTLAKNFAWLFSEGFGSSDSQWSTFIELAAEPLRKLMEPEVGRPSSRVPVVESDLDPLTACTGGGIFLVRRQEWTRSLGCDARERSQCVKKTHVKR